MIRLTMAGIVLLAIASPAFADQYWIVLDPSSQKCSIVEQASKDATAAAPANTAFSKPFATRAAAEDSMQRMRKCGIAE